MKKLWEAGLVERFLVLILLIPLLGISIHPQAVTRWLEQARRAQEAQLAGGIDRSKGTAAGLAQAAGQLTWRTDLWEQAGFAALREGDAPSAARYLSRAAALGSLSPSGQLALGDAYFKAGDLRAAVQAWKSAPGSLDALTRQAQAHHDLGDIPAEIEDLKAIISLQPGDAPTYYRLGLLLAATRPEASLAYLSQAAHLDSRYFQAFRSIQDTINTSRPASEPAYTFVSAGRALASLGEWEVATEAFRQAILSRPDYAEGWAFLGEALQQDKKASKNPQAGLAELQQAWKLDPTSVAVNTLFAFYWQRQNRYDNALVYLKAAASLDPSNPVLQTEIGNTQSTLGDLDAAQASYQKATGLAPKDPTYWRILAEFSLQHNLKIQEIALPAAQQAVAISPKDPVALDLLGQALFLIEDTTTAERCLSQAIALQPGYAPAHLHLAMLYLVQGSLSQARSELELALSLAPNSPTADQAKRLLEKYFQ